MTEKDAIVARRSVRNFSDSPLCKPFFVALSKMIAELKPLTADAMFQVKVIGHDDLSKVIASSAVPNAPYFMLFYGEECPEYAQNIGFIAEKIVLYLTAQGVSSLFLGSLRAKEPVEDGLRYTLAIAFGKSDTPFRTAGKETRKPLEKLFTGLITDKTRALMDAARLAPSAMNLQPWFFELDLGQIRVFRRKALLPMAHLDLMQRIDIGICLANILTADDSWTAKRLTALDAPSKYGIPEYVLTRPFVHHTG